MSKVSGDIWPACASYANIQNKQLYYLSDMKHTMLRLIFFGLAPYIRGLRLDALRRVLPTDTLDTWCLSKQVCFSDVHAMHRYVSLTLIAKYTIKH